MATPGQGPVASRDLMIYRCCERLCRTTTGFAAEAMIECLSGKDAVLDAPIYFTYLGLNCQRVGIGAGRV